MSTRPEKMNVLVSIDPSKGGKLVFMPEFIECDPYAGCSRSVRIIRPSFYPRILKEGEEWELEITGIKLAKDHTRDGRRKVFVFGNPIRRVIRVEGYLSPNKREFTSQEYCGLVKIGRPTVTRVKYITKNHFFDSENKQVVTLRQIFSLSNIPRVIHQEEIARVSPRRFRKKNGPESTEGLPIICNS